MHRFFVCLAALMIAVSAFMPVMGKASEPTWTMAGFDGDNVGHDWTTNAFFQRMHERTGMTFDYLQYKEYEAWAQAKAQMLEDEQTPDVFFKAEMTLEEIAAFEEKDLLLDLAPLLQEHAPNVYRYVQSDEKVRTAVTRDDGKILTLPSINDLPNNNVIWVNRHWLETLKMEMPTDTESFRKMLEAFKTKDPNGNGQQDEIPMTSLGIWDLKFLGHAFGLIANDYNVFLDEQGTVQHLALQPQFRAFVEWLNGLYKDELLDQRGFTTFDIARRVLDEKSLVKYGVLMGTTTMDLLPYVDPSVFDVLQPLVWEGEQIYRDLIGSVYPGAFALSKDCPEPEKVLAWIDFLYTEEGGKLAMVGIEGEEYEIDPDDGIWEWIGDITTRGEQIVREVAISESGNMPWRFPLEFQLKYGDRDSVHILEQLYELRRFTEQPFPLVIPETEDARRIAELQYDLGLYLDTQVSAFVIGQNEITDENWQRFLNDLDAKGLQEFLILWQKTIAD